MLSRCMTGPWGLFAQAALHLALVLRTQVVRVAPNPAGLSSGACQVTVLPDGLKT